jgi:hypothetical protein
MIRPFQLRDLALVHRLGEQGVVFQTQAALTNIPHPVRRAVVHMLVGGRHSTFVWKSDQRNAAGFAQLSWQDGNGSAHLACLATEPPLSDSDDQPVIDEDVWLPLLDDLTAEAGRRGFHNLIAEAAEDGPELPILRRAGFAVYTRQDIWICDQLVGSVSLDNMMPRQSVDDWDISVLYSNIIPGLIQSVEPNPPLDVGRNWILRENGELVALIHTYDGSVAGWMRLLIHPNAQTKPKIIIGAALQQNPPSPEHPIYCCVRRYQSWLQSSLEKAGFRPWGSQVVLVKHIALHARSRAPVNKGVLEAQAVPGTSPSIQGFSHTNGHDNH